MAAADLVLSEVHMETCPPQPPGATWCTRFAFSLPEDAGPDDSDRDGDGDGEGEGAAGTQTVDGDGDLVVRARRPRRQQRLTIHHSLATPLSRCGEQVWLGACVLADLVLARQQHRGRVVTELGAGVGLAGLAAARAAAAVFLTDVDAGALRLASRNAQQAAADGHLAAAPDGQRSAAAAADGGSAPDARGGVRVRRLDVMALFDAQLQHISSDAEVLQLLNSTVSDPPCTATREQQQQQQQQHHQHQHHEQHQHHHQQPYAWLPEDLDLLAQTHVWLAADVIYDEALTDAFMHAAAQLMRWQQRRRLDARQRRAEVAATGAAGAGSSGAAAPTLLVAAEKRFNFTLRDMDAVAPAFEHFLTYVAAAGNEQQPQLAASRDCAAPSKRAAQQAHQQPLFLGRRQDVADIPQHLEYDRNTDCLEVWELTLLPS